MALQNKKKLWRQLIPLEQAKYLKETKPDCVFVVGLEKFPSHKWILSEVSPVFERMFNGDFKEAKSSDEIPLTDEAPDIFKKFLHWIYHNKVSAVIAVENAALDTVIGLYNIANKYLVKPLMEDCVRGIRTSFHSYDDYDLLKSLEFANTITSCYNESSLIEDIERALQRRLEQNDQCVMRCMIFYDWDSELFFKFIQSLGKYIKHAVLFHTIEMYAVANGLLRCEDFANTIETNAKATPQTTKDDLKPPDCTLPAGKCATLEQMLSCVNYSQMTLKEFRNGPAKSKFLSILEKNDLIAQVPSGRTVQPDERNVAPKERHSYRPYDFNKNPKHRT